MEELLNKLIEKGWKVYGVYDALMAHGQSRGKRIFCFGVLGEVKYSLRELVSKESGLWQFVCKNKLIKRPKGEAPEDVRVRRYVETMGIVWNRCFGKRKPEFYIIESALKDESELESFILDNIKVDG